MRAVAVVLVCTAVLAACGDPAAEEPAAPKEASGPNELRFTQADGTSFTVTPEGVRCAPSELDPAVETVQVVMVERRPRSRLVVEVVPEDVEGGKAFELPLSQGDLSRGPANAFVFHGSKDHEVSTSQEGADGRLTVTEAGCDPAVLDLSIEGSLGSEYGDGAPLEVAGRIDLGG